MSEFIAIFIDLFFEMALYLMIGLFFVGLMFIFVSKDMISKQIGKDDFWSILKAALFGVPLPLCSCGVVPSAVYLSKSGASKGSVISFLTSTPQTGVDSIIATYGMMGPVFAIFRPVVALIMGVAGGMFVRVVGKSEQPVSSSKFQFTEANITAQHKTFPQKIKEAMKYSFIEFLDDIAPQFIVGLFIASLITYFVPDSFFDNTYISSGILGMLLMIAIGAPMYVCATASIPIALSLIMKGFSPGVAFVFLVVGPATNAASFAILMKTLGKKVSFAYLGVLIVLSIFFGYLLDYLFALFSWNAMDMMAMPSHQHEMGAMSWDKWLFGTIFLILILGSLYRLYISKYFKKMEENKTMKTIKVKGMSCNHCVMNVTKAIESVQGVESVVVDLPSETARIDGNFNMDEVKKKIEGVGYEVQE